VRVGRVGVGWVGGKAIGDGALDELGPRVVAGLLSFTACSTYIISPVLLAHDGGRASFLRLDVLGTPRLYQVVVVLATQLFVDVIAHLGSEKEKSSFSVLSRWSSLSSRGRRRLIAQPTLGHRGKRLIPRSS
jgi:hypothetical protein